MIQCKLSTILGEKRLSQIDVVRNTGLARATVNELYHDRVTRMDFRVLNSLCEYLKCTPGDLLKYFPDDTDNEQV